MSDTPFIDNVELSVGLLEGPYVNAELARQMERHLRRLLAMANCYVPVNTLKEIQDFLQSTETKK